MKIQLTSKSEHVSAIEPENSISHCNAKFVENLDEGSSKDAGNTCADSE